MQLVFVGPPGAGKGTQAERLAAYLDVPHLSTGEMLRAAIEQGTEVGKSAETYIAAGHLVPDEMVTTIVGQRLNESDCASGFLLDGFPRTLAQAEKLDQLLLERNTSLDLVLELAVDGDLLVERLTSRGREDDTPDVIRQRFEVYRKQTEPLLKYYRDKDILESVDGAGTREEVRQRVRDIVKYTDQAT